MGKVRTQFVCQQCGTAYSKWAGRCDNCGAWNSLVEQEQTSISQGSSAVSKASVSGHRLRPKTIRSVKADSSLQRIRTGLSDLDNLLGGGIVPGSVILLAGQPGIGKSTLLLQLTAHVAQDLPVLYVSGEESEAQIALRASRLGVDTRDKLSIVSSTSANDIAATISGRDSPLVIVDSIQTISVNELTSAPGTVSQITGSSNVLIRAAKSSQTAIILVGHVTKEGGIAGPKVLEHLVDVVLQFDGDRYGGLKTVRAIKNRFGATSEAAIFEMDEAGLKPVDNPSAVLLAERQTADGSVVLATIEGNRPLLVEVQALVNHTNFGYPKRAASGFDLNRLNLLIAVLERRTKLDLSDKDVYINIVGGLKLDDRAADLAVCMAIASAAAGKTIDDNTVVYGEVGLGGEIRSAAYSDRRIAEAQKLGFKRAIAPKSSKTTSMIKPVKDIRSALIGYLQ